MTLHSGYNMPDGCFSTPYDDIHCDKCDRVTDELTEISEGYEVCDSCLDEYTECRHCGKLFETEDMYSMDGKDYCNDCYGEYVVECVICEKVFDIELDCEEYDGLGFCDTCKKELEHI